MSNDNKTPDTRCPSQLDLSVYSDREGAGHVEPHLVECPSCQTVVVFYGRLNDAVKQNLTPPECLAERIKEACRRDAAEQRRRQFQLLFWRAAAVVAVLVAAAALAVKFNGVQATGTPPSVATNAGHPAGSILTSAPSPALVAAPGNVVAEGPDSSEPEGAVEPLPALSAVGADNIMHVGTAPDEFGTDANVHIAANRVRHVWVVANVDFAARLFASFIPPQAQWTQDSSRDGGAAFQVLLPDKDLQALVDSLSAAGFSLVSPMFPQPGEKRKLLASGRNVVYDVDLVPASQTTDP